MTHLDPKALEAACRSVADQYLDAEFEGDAASEWERIEPFVRMGITSYLAALPQAELVAVKPLRFEKQNIDGTVWASEFGVCAGYLVKFNGSCWQVIQGMVIIGTADTSAEAISLAQADRASRILETLASPTPAVSREDVIEPMAYIAQSDLDWLSKNGKTEARLHRERVGARFSVPLFASPPPNEVEAELLAVLKDLHGIACCEGIVGPDDNTLDRAAAIIDKADARAAAICALSQPHSEK